MLRCMILTEPEQTLRTRPLHRREYQSLAELGLFDDEDVELLDGRIVVAAAEDPPHAGTNGRLARILIEGIPGDGG